MSSRSDGKKWMKLCKHMREAIIDEQKAVPDYMKLIREFDVVGRGGTTHDVGSVVEDIIEDEKRHKNELLKLFNHYCPRMAVHRKGIRE